MNVVCIMSHRSAPWRFVIRLNSQKISSSFREEDYTILTQCCAHIFWTRPLYRLQLKKSLHRRHLKQSTWNRKTDNYWWNVMYNSHRSVHWSVIMRYSQKMSSLSSFDENYFTILTCIWGEKWLSLSFRPGGGGESQFLKS